MLFNSKPLHKYFLFLDLIKKNIYFNIIYNSNY